MLEKLAKAWRARRVLLIGLPDAQNLYAEALLCALGARPARLPPDAKAHTLCRALTSGRIGAVMIPCMQDVAAGSSLTQRLDALGLILREMREAGVPLGILCSHEDVYAPRQDAWQAEEGAPLGGRTREGLYQAILQLYADGVGRALLGDAVTTIVCRHAPCLGSDEESVRQYSAWCRAILGGGAPVIEHPGAQGVFLHPLDAVLGALCLGARFFLGENDCAGAFNIAPGPAGLCANRSACLRLMQEEGCTRAAAQAHPPCPAPRTQLSGAKIRRLCGFSPQLDAQQALTFLMEHERAQAIGDAAAQLKRREQAERLLKMLG